MTAILTDTEASQAVRAVFEQPEVVRLCDAFHSPDGVETLRLVGGTVRDLYLGRKAKDLDFATTLTPSEVVAACARTSIPVSDIGAGRMHGTIIANGFEITTLRLDAKTDGRHATVEFTRDWEEDSNRRDFTINALYGGPEGTIYDYHGGLADMHAQRLRFIGDPSERIKEDALRVLRFYRFQAELGFQTSDEDDKAVADAGRAKLVEQLSGERLWAELSRILSVDLPTCHFVLADMYATGILKSVIGGVYSGWSNCFDRYTEIDVELPDELKERMARLLPLPEQESLVRLTLLLTNGADLKHLRFSKRQMAWLSTKRCSSVAEWNGVCQAIGDKSSNPIPYALAMGRRFIATGLAPEVAYADFVNAALVWESKPFPVNGYDLLERGIDADYRMGAVLRDTRAWWVEQDRAPDKDACLAHAGRYYYAGRQALGPHI